jgi:hypothetical protein
MRRGSGRSADVVLVNPSIGRLQRLAMRGATLFSIGAGVQKLLNRIPGVIASSKKRSCNRSEQT